MRFSELFAETTSRTEVVVTFLALLELIRMKQLRILQPEPFAEIEISVAPPRIEGPHDTPVVLSLGGPAENSDAPAGASMPEPTDEEKPI